MDIPKDPFILLSYVNTKLRDFYSNLDDLCEELEIPKEDIVTALKKIDYKYDLKLNRFV